MDVDSFSKMVTGGAITTGLFALCIWWITRYIKDRDDFEKAMKEEIKGVPSKIKESISKIDEAQREMTRQVESVKNTALDFQRSINQELSSIERHAVKTEAVMEKTAIRAENLEKQITSMSNMVQFHDKVLKDLITFSKDLKIKTQENAEEIITVKRKINDDLVIIGQKKKKPDNKE